MKGHSEEGGDEGIPTEVTMKSWARYAARMDKNNLSPTHYSLFFFPWKCDTLFT
jgi:hypothetical protein